MESVTFKWPYSALVAALFALGLILIGLWGFVETLAMALGIFVKSLFGPFRIPLEGFDEDSKD